MTPTSRPKPPGYWISTPAPGTAHRWARTTTCSARTRSPSSKPCNGAIPAARPARAHTRQVEFEYHRGGTLAYFAAYDVHHARVIGTIAPKTGIEPFTDLVEKVMTSEPYKSARRVFWVVDNGSSHAGQASIDRMSTAWPTTTLVHLPIHASWLNQVVRHEVA